MIKKLRGAQFAAAANIGTLPIGDACSTISYEIEYPADTDPERVCDAIIKLIENHRDYLKRQREREQYDNSSF